MPPMATTHVHTTTPQRPLACCPNDGTPLICSFERPQKEFVCLECGSWWEWLEPASKDWTQELADRYEDLRALYQQGIRYIVVDQPAETAP